MVKPVYDISPEDVNSIDWQNCRLVMELNDQYFLYTVIYSGSLVVALRYYAFSINTSYPLREQLYEIVKSDEVLHKQMNEVMVIYNLPENALIPEEYFSQELSQEVVTFLHGDLRKGTLLSEKLEQEKMYNVFRIPSEIHEFFQTGFPHARFWHYFSIWSACTPTGQRSIDGVSVIFYPNNLMVAVNAGGKQQLLQSIAYQTPEDVAYHLLNIFNQFEFSQEATPLEIGGLVDVDSAVYEELLKYFQLIERIAYPSNLQLPSGFEELPKHFFSPLLNLALCVS
jgi:hypothetical protein